MPQPPISLIRGNTPQMDTASGELVVVSDTSRDDTLALVIGAMAKSTSTIAVQFFTRDYRFSPDDLDTALVYLFESCT